ncbi:hypothetical protein [Azovibrio restrictus]|uniref:hypothetical protein n=1 Tax=Azovibrio restrictus TaxID=146938 RepID=UPI0026EDD147|nr:hypothetical protein [Azovibrio restrictus]MDD3482311.1 hypothetical protein [Azovibrio restrictus]
MGELALALLTAIGDLCAGIVGKLIGRTFRLEPEQAWKIGELALTLMVAAAIVITLLYS